MVKASPQFGCLGPMTSSLYVLAWMAPKSFEFVITKKQQEDNVRKARFMHGDTVPRPSRRHTAISKVNIFGSNGFSTKTVWPTEEESSK